MATPVITTEQFQTLPAIEGRNPDKIRAATLIARTENGFTLQLGNSQIVLQYDQISDADAVSKIKRAALPSFLNFNADGTLAHVKKTGMAGGLNSGTGCSRQPAHI